MAMGIHSFFAGVALGVSSKSEDCWNMVIAIASHKWSEAMVVGISFVSAEIEYNEALKYLIFYSFMTPLGVLLGLFI